ncbi:HTH-type sugar sensing transcriptional regulator TrmB [uncultured archaeon]|nr:HTH-type sugar sensing transcriptional regulator TrmB [uncultured archaeon]
MEKLKIFLGELGFGKNEVEVYTALLGMGESTVLQISKKTGVHRSNIYEALDTLIKKGLVSSIENPIKKYFPRNPKCLLEFIKSKEIEFSQISQELENKTSSSCETKIGRTKGKLAFRDSLFNLLTLSSPIYVFGVKSNSNEAINLAFDLFHRERIRRKIKMRMMYHSNEKSAIKSIQEIKKRGYTEVKKFPMEYNSEITTFICSSKIIIMNWTDLSIVEIEDKEIATDYSKYFDVLWNVA